MSEYRICSICGAKMNEGWYLDAAGYACSDECAAKYEGISMDEFKRYRIFKSDIIDYLNDNKIQKDISQLTDEECDEIITLHIFPYVDYCYTVW